MVTCEKPITNNSFAWKVKAAGPLLATPVKGPRRVPEVAHDVNPFVESRKLRIGPEPVK